MLRGMVFVDHMNFDIAAKKLFKKEGTNVPRIDYNTFFGDIPSERKNITFTKTLIFAPKPDDFLMKDPVLTKYYKWVSGLESSKYIDVTWGRYIARPTQNNIPMSLDDRNSYYKVEKGTDINLAIHLLTKAFYNSYDVAFVLSADTDYISVYKQLKNIGKIVIPVTVKGQNISKLIPEVDDYIILGKDYFESHQRPDPAEEKEPEQPLSE